MASKNGPCAFRGWAEAEGVGAVTEGRAVLPEVPSQAQDTLRFVLTLILLVFPEPLSPGLRIQA